MSEAALAIQINQLKRDIEQMRLALTHISPLLRGRAGNLGNQAPENKYLIDGMTTYVDGTGYNPNSDGKGFYRYDATNTKFKPMGPDLVNLIAGTTNQVTVTDDTQGGVTVSLPAAVTGKLVTNGDSHDHDGGDGARIPLAGLATLAANSIMGNNTGSAATVIALTAAQVKTLLAIAQADVSGLTTASTPTFAGLSFPTGAHAGVSTSDASDTGYLSVGGAGSAGVTRGGTTYFYGNEHATKPGQVEIIGGDITGGDINFYVNGSATPQVTIDQNTNGNTGFGVTSPTNRIHVAGAIASSSNNAVNEASIFKMSQESTTVSQLAAYGPNTSTAGTLNIIMKSSDASVNNVAMSFAASGNVSFGGLVRLKGYTVATLPAGTQGDTAYVTDAVAPTFLGALVGGGAVVTPVFYNGTAWVSF